MPANALNLVDYRELSFELQRRLLTLIREPRTESEVMRYAVDSISEFLVGCRVSYSLVMPNGNVEILYSKGPPAMRPLTGLRMSLGGAPAFLESLFKLEPVIVRDSFLDEPALLLHATVPELSEGRARLHVSFSVGDGNVGLFSVTLPDAFDWPPALVKTLTELSEMVHLLCREARVRDRLEKSEKMFRQFTDHVSQVLWMTDPRTQQVLFVSPAYERVWGRSIESLHREPLSFLEAVVQEDRHLLLEGMKQHFVGPAVKEYRVRRPDGSIVWVKDQSFPVLDGEGQVHRVVGLAEDITTLKEAQSRLETTRAQVLANAKLAALGEMASGIAHEINNPLAVIHGLAVQLKEVTDRQAKPEPFFLETLGTIEKMANRIAGIVKGLRTFSRQTDWDPMGPCDLKGLLEETVALCEVKLQAAAVRLQIDLPADFGGLRCRSSEICQVLLNLLNNAIDAAQDTPEPTVRIRVSRLNEKIVIAVEDSGPGVPASLRQRIFEPFFTTKEVGKGTGLGLSISRNLVEGHGGTLRLDTDFSGGRFVLELPAEASCKV